jgi:hypothetical protein
MRPVIVYDNDEEEEEEEPMNLVECMSISLDPIAL